MSYPTNPDTIVLQNKFYPNGLTEIDIWNYYQSVKPLILKETIHRELMFYIFPSVNKLVVKRKISDGYIRLDPKNYDTIMTGKTVSIHSSMNMYEKIGIIDVDVADYDGFKWAKRATNEIYNYVMDKMPIVKKATIRFTGKKSFHIVCDFNSNTKIDVIKFLFEKFLKESPLSKVYTINARKTSIGVPNIDLNRNCHRCNFVTLGSLSEFGLKCMEVNYNDLMKFDIRHALIK